MLRLKTRVWAGFLFLFSISNSVSALEIAFLKMKNRSGEVISLESGVDYSHVAISFGNLWLHTSPTARGVELVSSLAQIGEVSVVLSNSDESEIESDKVMPLLGMAYDTDYDWTSNNRLYCSELIAKLLGIEPQPMSFDPKLWPSHFQMKNGLPGLSPADLYRELEKRGYKKPESSCEASATLTALVKT